MSQKLPLSAALLPRPPLGVRVFVAIAVGATLAATVTAVAMLGKAFLTGLAWAVCR